MVVFVAAVALVFLLLLFLYESFRVAVAMLLMTTPGDGGRVCRPLG